MVKLGIAGMGYIGRVHLEAAGKVTSAEVVAVSSSRPDQIRSLHPTLDIYSDYSALLSDSRLDAVIVCVPTFLHELYALEAVHRGLHVLCEKPLALDSAAGSRIVSSAKSGRTVLMAGHVLRFWPQYVAIKQMVEAGRLGHVRSVSAQRLTKYPPWAEWFRDPAKSGGCVLDLQIHDLDFTYWLLGLPSTVRAVGLKGDSGGWDHVYTTLTYPETVVNIEATSLMPKSWPFTSGIRVNGDAGAVEYTFRAPGDMEKRDEAIDQIRFYRPDGVIIESEVQAEDCFAAQLKYFVKCVETQTAPLTCPPEESLKALRMAEACRRSLDTGMAVSLGTTI
jgi:UDP-N-acetylglucosamine 3-dehydrogenase